MTNIRESCTSRLAWERLEAIKKFIPVDDSVREKLQARQEAKVEFAKGAEELFKPVTTATGTVKTAIKGKPDPVDSDKEKPGLLQVLQKHGKTLEDISAGFHPPPGAEAAAGPTVISKKIKSAKCITPAERFVPEFVKILKGVQDDQLAEVIV